MGTLEFCSRGSRVRALTPQALRRLPKGGGTIQNGASRRDRRWRAIPSGWLLDARSIHRELGISAW